MKTSIPTSILLRIGAAIFCIAVAANGAKASTLWTQQWDSTPQFNSLYDEIQIEAGLGSSATLEAIDGFITGGIDTDSLWASNLINPTLADAVFTGPSLPDGNAGSNVNLFNVNFSSPENVPALLQVRYYLGGTLVSDNTANTWNFDGFGIGNNPVGNWSAPGIPNLFVSSQTPEPATFGLVGAALAALGLSRRRRQN